MSSNNEPIDGAIDNTPRRGAINNAPIDGAIDNTPRTGATDIAVELIDVHKSFRGGKEHVLQGISIKFPREKLTYILGPSGTGKSVTIKHILGLLKPDSGTVLVEGKDFSDMNSNELAKERRIFGMLFQNAALFDDMTIFENVAFPLYEHTKLSDAEIEKKVVDKLQTLGIESGFDKFPNELSGGMRKRVGLARAIIREPSILLYDEPTTGLDPVTRSTVDELILALKQKLKLTSIVISHDLPSALRLADKIVFLSGGKVVFSGTPEEFAHSKEPIIREFLESELQSANILMKHGIH